jgi:hypothetical protein
MEQIRFQRILFATDLAISQKLVSGAIRCADLANIGQ